MKVKVNKSLVPIKAHFFFFFAALGPLLPQMNVFGRQLGVSPAAMGLVTAVLPLLWAAAKPLFGYVVDYWPNHRKLVFMLLITTMTGSYCGLWFIPTPDEPEPNPPLLEYVYQLNDTVYIRKYPTSELLTEGNPTSDDSIDYNSTDYFDYKEILEKYKCHWNCNNETSFEVYLSNNTFINTMYVDDVTNSTCSLFHMDFDDFREGEMTCVPKTDCNLLCFEDGSSVNDTILNSTVIFNNNSRLKRSINNTKESNSNEIRLNTKEHKLLSEKKVVEENIGGGNLYTTGAFWLFVVLMCLGTVAFNVANCIGDAVCFDVLGPENSSKYGSQRAWGTAGYGITALLGGWLVDLASPGSVKDFTPAFVVAMAATAVDLFSCRKLRLPSLSSPEDSGKALRDVLRIPRVLVFILFAVVAGTFDSFIIYYMFWFLEEMAEQTGHMAKIKLIEGVIVAGQSLIGEILFFALSGKIIKRWGYGVTMTVSFFCYGVRMVLISLVQNPWHMVFIESIMQGPTYALCYSTIVGYAAQVAPNGYSSTVQGIVAGMDDGVGFALGSLIGGWLYSSLGGRAAFRTLAAVAATAALVHLLLARIFTYTPKKETPELEEQGEKMLSPTEDGNTVYRDTVVPLKEDR